MKEQIKGIGYDGKLWLLIDDVTQISVKVGDVRESFRGEKAIMEDLGSRRNRRFHDKSVQIHQK